MTFRIRPMPTDRDELNHTLEEYGPFIGAMYRPEFDKFFGEPGFLLDHWLFLWEQGTGFVLEKRNEEGQLQAVALLSLFRDLWYGNSRLDIQGLATEGPGSNTFAAVDALIAYLIEQAPLMRFESLFYRTCDPQGNEHKFLLWSKKENRQRPLHEIESLSEEGDDAS